MNKNNLVLFLSVFCVGLVACSSRPSVQPSATINSSAVVNAQQVKSNLLVHYQEWKGTPYKNGGLAKHGVDCSGFVYLTFLQQFNVRLPRSTAGQSEIGFKVQRSQLLAGDLIFFKTGWKERHVGIYLDNNSFLHASTGRGVMVSRLDNPYWQSKYWHSRRFNF